VYLPEQVIADAITLECFVGQPFLIVDFEKSVVDCIQYSLTNGIIHPKKRRLLASTDPLIGIHLLLRYQQYKNACPAMNCIIDILPLQLRHRLCLGQMHKQKKMCLHTYMPTLRYPIYSLSDLFQQDLSTINDAQYLCYKIYEQHELNYY